MSLLDNLVSAREFENNVNDSHGSNHGTVVGTSAFVDGAHGRAFDFNGSTRINVGNDASLNFTTAMSMETWVWLDSLGGGGYGRFIDKRHSGSGGYFVAPNFGASSLIQYHANTNSTYSASAMPTGRLVHVVVTKSGSTITFYVDGEPDGTGTVLSSLGVNSLDFCIGGNTAGNRNMDGRMECLRLWNRALTPTEVTQLYNSGNGLSYGEVANFTPVNISPPVIAVSDDDDPVPGVNLVTSIASEWDDRDNGSGTTTYQWFADDVLIDGATSETFNTAGLDIGVELTRRDRRTNNGGYDSDEDVVSNGIILVAEFIDFAVNARNIRVIPSGSKVVINKNQSIVQSSAFRCKSKNAVSEDISDFASRLLNRFKAYRKP